VDEPRFGHRGIRLVGTLHQRQKQRYCRGIYPQCKQNGSDIVNYERTSGISNQGFLLAGTMAQLQCTSSLQQLQS